MSAAGDILTGGDDPGSAGAVLGDEPAAPDPGPVSSVPDWAQELGDPETQSFIGTKGWQTPEALVESYKSLESKLGVPETALVRLKPIEDRDAWHGENGIFEKLGRPKTADDYELPAGLDEALATKFRSVAFEEGLSGAQVKRISEWFAQEGNAGAEAAQLAVQARQQQELTQVRNEWGQDWESNVTTARAGMAALGITPEMATAMEQQVGTRELLNRMLNVGKLLHGAQHGVHGENSMPTMTPSEADREVARLKANPEFMERWMAGSPPEVQKMRALMEIAYPGTHGGSGTLDAAVE